MLPLILSHAWFTIFGRTPWAYLAFLTICNLLAAGGIAAILRAAGISWRRLGAACVLLPLAIMPNNYSLMHPLEMLLIIWALAHQARGRYGAALAFAVMAVFTKPSMPYVLGLLLLILGFLYQSSNHRTQGLPSQGLRDRLQKAWPILIPPTLTALALVALSILAVGLRPAFANIFPLTGGRSYRLMNFGIFHAGREFWLHGGSPTEIVRHYLCTPATFWILASLLLWTLGIRALIRLGHRHPAETSPPPAARPCDPLLLTLALLHGAFVFVFYAWSGSWTYYSYLLVIGLLVGLRGHRQTIMLRVLLVIALLGLSERYADAFGRWWGMSRAPDTGGLFFYNDGRAEVNGVRALACEYHGLYLVNGALPMLWPEAQTPPVWFLSPGIPTATEIALVQEQMNQAGAIILDKDYDQTQEAWFWPEFAQQRKPFELRTWKIFIWTFKEKPLYESPHVLVLKRHD